MTAECLSEIDIMAYVDGELDLNNQLAVEEHLSRNPGQAAEVMGELRTRTALKLLSGRVLPIPDKMLGLTQRIEADRKPGRFRQFALAGVGVMAFACAALLFWAGRNPSPPPYVISAVASHRTAMLRAAMASQLETPHYDASEILSKTNIAMPNLPADWRVTDVQLFPFDRGPALMVVVRTPRGEALSIFAIREPTAAPERPNAIQAGAESVAFWRLGDVSYALIGDDAPEDVDASAEALAHLWKS